MIEDGQVYCLGEFVNNFFIIEKSNEGSHALDNYLQLEPQHCTIKDTFKMIRLERVDFVQFQKKSNFRWTC